MTDMNKVKLIFIRAFLLVACLFYSNTIKAYDFEVDGLCYNKLSNNQVEITYRVLYDGGYSGNLMIPEEVKYGGIVYDVVAIGNLAFYNCKKLTGTLTIPSSITSIGYNAFTNCEGFTGSLVIPNSVISIGGQAFMGCKGLNGSLILPNSISSIEKETFTKCSGLKGTLKIPSKVRSIGRLAFGDCSGLTGSLTIPSSVTTIDEWAFFGCGFTGSLTIPNSVTSIGPCAFYYCKLLTLVQSYIENPFIIDNNVFESISSSAKLVVPKGTKSKYQALSGWTSHFKEIVEFGDASTYTLSITASGSGSASYSGATVRNKTSSFTVNEGASATITFTPDNGYRIKSVKVNNSTVSVSNNQYTISSINANTTVSVEFEAIPVTTYTLSITASGNGSASYGGNTIRSKTTSFTVNEGTSVTIIFTPDNGYRIKSVKVNNAAVSVSNNQYTISSINANTTISVEFEAIPPTTYTLSITASGNGSASYGGTTIRSKTSSFTVNEGSNVSITITPDNGYRIKSVKENNTLVTSYVSNNIYTINSISRNTTVDIEFEAIPPTTYTLSITVSGNGSATYDGTSIRENTKSFTVEEGANAIITLSPDEGYKVNIAKTTGNNTSNLYNNTLTFSNIKNNLTVELEFLAIPTYTLSIKSTGNGSASYNGTTIRNKTSNFTLNQGKSATISFSPDNGYRIKSVKVNGLVVSVSNNEYVINSISKNTTIEVEFENTDGGTEGVEINGIYYNLISKAKTAEVTSHPTKYTGDVVIPETISYEGVTFEVNTIGERAFERCSGLTSVSLPSTIITICDFAFDYCYNLKTINLPEGLISIGMQAFCEDKFTSINIPSSVTKIGLNAFALCDNLTSVNIDNLNAWLNIKFAGSGSSNPLCYAHHLYLNGTEIRNLTIPEDITEIQMFAFYGCSGLESIDFGNVHIIGNNSFHLCTSIDSISFPKNVSTIKSEAFRGCDHLKALTFEGSTTILSKAFSNCKELTDVYCLVNGATASSNTFEDSYISSATLHVPYSAIEAYKTESPWNEFGKIVELKSNENIKEFSVDNVNYAVVPDKNQSVTITGTSAGSVLDVPVMVRYQDIEWTVIGINNGALANNMELAAVIWHLDTPFTENVTNPNFLLYVNQAQYAPSSIKNVVVNGTANSITLTDAFSGNNFYCPKEFTAQKVSYTHHYTMETGLGNARGWETIALPFDVQKIEHQSKGEIVPFANWKSGDAKKPFWLMTYGTSGWAEANSIKANTPYIISMPNHSYYKPEFRLNGNVTFSAENITIPTSENLHSTNYNGKTFIPNYMNLSNNSYYALNVNNDYVTYSGDKKEEGSKFLIGQDYPRAIHPFEAYMTSASQTRSYIAIGDDMTTGIGNITEIMVDEKIVRVYNLNGQSIMAEENKSVDEIKALLSAGVYIVNGKKLIIK